MKSERQKDKLRREYADLNKMVKKSARIDKRKFMESMAEKAAKSHELHTLYKISQQICRSKNNYNNTPIRDSHGQLLTAEHEQELRWTNYFSNVLNRPDPEHPPDIQPASRRITVNLNPPNKQEILKAISSLKNNKAPGKDELTAELFKADPASAANVLEPLFADIWEKEELY